MASPQWFKTRLQPIEPIGQSQAGRVVDYYGTNKNISHTDTSKSVPFHAGTPYVYQMSDDDFRMLARLQRDQRFDRRREIAKNQSCTNH